MDKNEAKQVLKIISTADGGCQFCVTELLDKFVSKFPEHESETKVYYEKIDKELKEVGVKNG